MSNHKSEVCPECGFRFQCICSEIPKVTTSWHLALLTHPNELNRDTNTGKLLHRALTNSSVHIWDRVNPPASLIEMINSGDYQPVVLYPSDKSVSLSSLTQKDALQDPPYLFIILDGTWQEAKKMINKSPWLKELASVHLERTLKSEYKLRKNQEDGNLCTYEVGSHLISSFAKNKENYLDRFFNYYISVFNADKSGHKYRYSH
ncbi:DTW domain-containing protein [Vibrio hannami]|uniref:tRNA-uridine aminocarboxypropyltransferase n=1 Tax=Vibrio hannami TaxID=2717094 RepID=UPI00240F908A|nr:tRNA-uridine aminocarboxypropyltransferase [Vibrio hannami]MDG3086680.1 DTW domain-containing protein [Vibrio hannami]